MCPLATRRIDRATCRIWSSTSSALDRRRSSRSRRTRSPVAVVADTRQAPARVSAAYISSGGFELLGDRPVLGRAFRADEDRPGSPPVVILGGELWSSRYASDPAIVGQTITVNGVVSTVVGVMPRGFMFPGNADLWRPMANLPADVRESRAERRLAVFARLAANATEDQARADALAIGNAWAREFPATNRDLRMHVVPINEQLNPSVAQRAWIAFITAGALVLLVACANVANLLLMRAATRGREMAIRTSMGATRWRVVRQLLVESSTLAALAGVFGVFVAWVGLRALSASIPPETLPYWMAFTIDGRVLAVLIGVCVISVFVCGLPSALHVTKVGSARHACREWFGDDGGPADPPMDRRAACSGIRGDARARRARRDVGAFEREQSPDGVSDRSHFAPDIVGDVAGRVVQRPRRLERRSSIGSTSASARRQRLRRMRSRVSCRMAVGYSSR